MSSEDLRGANTCEVCRDLRTAFRVGIRVGWCAGINARDFETLLQRGPRVESEVGIRSRLCDRGSESSPGSVSGVWSGRGYRVRSAVCVGGRAGRGPHTARWWGVGFGAACFVESRIPRACLPKVSKTVCHHAPKGSTRGPRCLRNRVAASQRDDGPQRRAIENTNREGETCQAGLRKSVNVRSRTGNRVLSRPR